MNEPGGFEPRSQQTQTDILTYRRVKASFCPATPLPVSLYITRNVTQSAKPCVSLFPTNLLPSISPRPFPKARTSAGTGDPGSPGAAGATAGCQASWNAPGPTGSGVSDSVFAPAINPLRPLHDRSAALRGHPGAESGPDTEGPAWRLQLPPAPLTCQAWLLKEHTQGLAAFSQLLGAHASN